MKLRWNKEWPDPNVSLVQWPGGYAEIHGSRYFREKLAEYLEKFPDDGGEAKEAAEGMEK